MAVQERRSSSADAQDGLDGAGEESGSVTEKEREARNRGRLRRTPVLKLRMHDAHPAERYAADRLADLMRSIEEHGLIEPPVVSRRDDGSLAVLFGHRRAKASQLLALDRRGPDKIPVYQIEGLTPEQELTYLLIELFQRDSEGSVVQTAENLGRLRAMRAAASGRETVTIREFADIIPGSEKSAIGQFLRISDALQDEVLEPLVRQADKAGKTLLYKALEGANNEPKVKVLEAYREGGEAAMRRAIAERTKRGAPRKTVLRRTHAGGGYDLTVRYRPGMTRKDASAALKAVDELRARLEAVEGAVRPGRGNGEVIRPHQLSLAEALGAELEVRSADEDGDAATP